MKDIVIVANYAPVPGTQSNDRLVTIIDLLLRENYNIELITSSFSHSEKKPKEVEEEILAKIKYKFTMLNEPGYRKNVDMNRFYSHMVLAHNVTKYLKKRKKPDIIYAVTTSTSVGYSASRYAKKNNIKLVIDVQDLWPEAFKLMLNVPVLSDMVFYPLKLQADKIYSAADGIVGVSETYVNRALSVNKKVVTGLSVFLGTELEKFDGFVNKDKAIKPEGEFWVAYIGTLGHSYNLNDVIDAFQILKEKGLNNIKFIVMGDGPLKDVFIKRAELKEINCQFLGRLPYPDMVSILSGCDMAINPIMTASVASIINKVGDYAAAGLAVINTQESDEYKDLVLSYNIGYNISNGSYSEIAEKIEFLYNNRDINNELGRNNRKLAEEKFDRNKTYPKIIKLIKGIT